MLERRDDIADEMRQALAVHEPELAVRAESVAQALQGDGRDSRQDKASSSSNASASSDSCSTTASDSEEEN